MARTRAATLSVSSVEARGRRCGGSCAPGGFQGRVFHGGLFQGRAQCSTGHTHTAQCGVSGCNVAGVQTASQPQIINEGVTSAPQRQQAIRVTDSQGRTYYLVPQSQYESSTK